MTPNRLTAFALRCSFSAVSVFWLFAPKAQAQSAANAINGDYNGTYTCAIGPRTLKLSLLTSGNGSLTGVFTFYLPPTSHTQAFSYSLNGTFDAASGKFKLNPVKWETPPPGGYVMVGMDGSFDPRSGQVAGKITNGSCGAFQATRDQAASASNASVIALQASAAGTQATRQTNAQPAPPRGQPSATSMTGVYIGTYTCNGGPSKLKVSLIGAPDDSLAGFFIIDLPHDGPRFTYKLTGRYAWGIHQFVLTSVPWGPEPPAEYTMARLTGKYNPGSDLLRGYVASSFCSDFWGERDKSESPESIAAAMRTPPVSSPSRPQAPAEPGAAATKAALPPPAPPVPKTVVPAAPPPQNIALNKKPCDFITKSDAESILGATVEARRDGPYECSFEEPGFTSKAPKNKQVSLSVWYSASPNPGQYAVMRKNIADHKDAAAVMKEVTDFADAAIWTWTPGWGGSLDAFSRGTIQAQITISGLPEDAAQQNAKKLAARALGGAGKTGYAYARPGTAPAPMPAQSPASYGAAWMGQDRVIRGTVSRVSARFGARPYWLTIFFKESPDAAFVVCSPYPDMLQETVGDLYRLVGKTLEVTGQVEGAMCAGNGKAASIRVVDSQHYRVEGLQPATGRVAVRPLRDSAHPYAGLDICNGGKVDLDALLVKQAGVASTHLAPRDCAHVYEENGAGSAFVGFAFADSHGQWGTARRLDLLPDFGIDVLTRADRNVSVQRGSKDVSARLQLLFRPPVPKCTTPRSATEELPAFATRAERDRAASSDRMNPPKTSCDRFDYTLNAVAYPDTREVTFEKKCFECPPAHASPEQRAAERRAMETMSRISPLAGGILAGAAAGGEEQELKESLEGPPEFQRMNWSEMNLALANVRPSGGRPAEMPQYLIIRGTVSRVDVSPPGASEHWVNVYFGESPDQASTSRETVYGAFNACASDADIFEDMFGPDFRSRMIGQVLEVQGEYQRNYCKGWKGSIRISLAHQVHPVGAAR
jgi:hypothetical protein